MQRKKDTSMKVGEGAGGVGRQRSSGWLGWVWTAGGVPRSPAGHLPALVYQLAGLEPGPLLFRRTPQGSLRGSVFLGLPPPQQTRNQGLRCEQFAWKHTTAGGGQPTDGPCRDAGGRAGTGHFRTWLLRGTLRGRDPSQPGGV